jgi:hypothetical protein
MLILPAVLYGPETLSLRLMEERRLTAFGNRILRRIFESKHENVTGHWKK